ncbi:hypothetical protein GAYE_SCF04G2473 [Galdieria yellowstonensis]|uniref:F-box domain-containing protein n=1 Tax=Galdieria yellowstonensis TaxID=3028027 RepID=A0AAV9I7H3_9RHOD|nr:hypothetical protein GAYE_PCTG36G1022 [Galdieria yellowstonensis]KAK4524572.1 hypothetical protein GAYE_SCF04G2473 [Galdieria yellowstonensis]
MLVELSDDIIAKIFGFLEVNEVLQCSLVCKSWCRVARADQIWHTLCERYFSPNTLKSLITKLEENAISVSKSYCSESVSLGSEDLGFTLANRETQRGEVGDTSGSSESSTASDSPTALCGTKACCCQARKALANLIEEYGNSKSSSCSKYLLFKAFFRHFSRGSYYVSRIAKLLDNLETFCRRANLPAARTLLPGVDGICIERQTGTELPGDIYCLYRLCSGQYIPSDYSQFQGILGGYLFYDVLVDWNLYSICSGTVTSLGDRRILKIGQDLFWHNNRGSQGLFVDLETKHVIEKTQNHYVIASKDTVTYLEKYVNDLCSNHLMIDRNTKQILRFSLSATYSGHSDVVTGYIRIQATCLFVPGISRFSDNEEQDEFVFAYRIRISMLSSAPSHYIYRLEQRHWIVTDTDGHVENIRGPGVIGEHPMFRPGSVFDYASCAPLRGPVGKMKGSFTFRPLHYESDAQAAAPFSAQVGELQLNFFECYRFPPEAPERYLQLQERWEEGNNILC